MGHGEARATRTVIVNIWSVRFHNKKKKLFYAKIDVPYKAHQSYLQKREYSCFNLY